MGKINSHPEEQLLNFVNGALDKAGAALVEEHLIGCGDCASVVQVLRALKSQAGHTAPHSETSAAHTSSLGLRHGGTLLPDEPMMHPDVSELASFFYGKSPDSRRSVVAAHVALCRECAEAVAIYARAEQAAARYVPAQANRAEVPAKAWELIQDWEDSSFAKPRAPGEALDRQTLDKLLRLFRERDDYIQGIARESLTQSRGTVFAPELVPVVVVNRSGEFRGVELFQKIPDTPGTELLEHAGRSERFDNKQLHVVIEFGEGNYRVTSERIERYTTRVKCEIRPGTRALHTDYFVFEE